MNLPRQPIACLRTRPLKAIRRAGARSFSSEPRATRRLDGPCVRLLRAGDPTKLSSSIRIAIVLLFLVVCADRVPGQQAPPATQKPPAVVVPPGKPTVVLWPNGAPGSEARKGEAEEIDGETIRNVHNPAIIVFLPR